MKEEPEVKIPWQRRSWVVFGFILFATYFGVGVSCAQLVDQPRLAFVVICAVLGSVPLIWFERVPGDKTKAVIVVWSVVMAVIALLVIITKPSDKSSATDPADEASSTATMTSTPESSSPSPLPSSSATGSKPYNFEIKDNKFYDVPGRSLSIVAKQYDDENMQIRLSTPYEECSAVLSLGETTDIFAENPRQLNGPLRWFQVTLTARGPDMRSKYRIVLADDSFASGADCS